MKTLVPLRYSIIDFELLNYDTSLESEWLVM